MSTQYNLIRDQSIERFERIHLSTRLKLYNFVKKSVKGHDAAEDIVQECYIRLWINIARVKDDEKILPMLRTYSTNIIINTLHKSSRDAIREKIFCDHQQQISHPDEALHRKEFMRQYQLAVKTLPPRRQAIYRLVREEGLTHKETAERLSISVNTIEREINKALKAILISITTE